MFNIKRAYDTPSPKDGYRVFVERLWPRGISKEKAKLDLWFRDIAPSATLRKWFAHDPAKWKSFQKRYTVELKEQSDLLKPLLQKAKKGKVTLVYGARDEEHNSALVLNNFLARMKL